MRTFFIFLILFSSSKGFGLDCKDSFEDHWDSGFTLQDIKVFIQETNIVRPEKDSIT